MLEKYPDVLTTKDMLSILRTSKGLLYKSIRLNQIPAYRIGNKWRFNKEDIINHFKTNVNSANSNRL